MVDLGRPDQYGDAQGVVELFRFHSQFAAGPVASAQLELLETDEAPMLYRVRFVSVFGTATGGAGGFALTFQGLPFGGLGDPWPNGGPLVAAADTEVAAGEGFHYAWNTEISDNYANLDADFGRIWVGGLPLVYLPRQTTFSVLFTAKGGYVGDFDLQGGHMQMERFAADRVTAGPDRSLDEVYLLPVSQ